MTKEPSKAIKAEAKDTEKSRGDDNSKEASKESNEKGGNDGVLVPEEFQKRTHELLKDANEHHLNHVRQQLNYHDDRLREAKRKNKPQEFGMDSAPADL